MEYLIMIYGDESYPAPAPGTPEFETMMSTFMAYNQSLIDGGHWIVGANLAPSTTASTVKKNFDGTATVVDGPFAETKEQLAGYYLVNAADLDEALELAHRLPLPVGSVEVRPVTYRPDAG